MKSLGREIPLAIEKLTKEIRETVEQVVPGAQAILYGSQAREEAGADSDFDLLILFPEPVSSEVEEVLDRALYDLELKWGVVLSTLVYNLKAWNHPLCRAMPLHQAVEREGILL